MTPGPLSSASTSVPPGSMGRQWSLPLRQSDAEEEARMVSKSLSCSRPERGLPGLVWARVEKERPSASVERSRRAFIVGFRFKLADALIYRAPRAKATEEFAGRLGGRASARAPSS